MLYSINTNMKKLTPLSHKSAIFISLFAGLVLVAGCATGHNPRVPEARELVMGGNTLSDEEAVRLSDGRRLYMNECAVCHSRIWPDERTPDGWNAVLTRHRGRTPIDDNKFKNLADYLLRVSYCFETRKCQSLPVKSH
jgi:hypothetical protein